MNQDQSSQDNPQGDDRDNEIDHELSEVGSRLRDRVDATLADGVVVAANARRVDRLRRTNRVLAAAAAVLVVAMIGSLAWAGTRDTRHAEVASGTKLFTPQSLAAEKLVATLPDQPVDPHTVKLVSTVSRFDTCDALAAQLRKVGAAHVGSQGFGGLNAMPMAVATNARMMESASDSASAAPVSANQLAFSDGGVPSATGETLGTNVIVEGVDEPDMVKAVGTLVIEVRSNNSLRIIDTSKQGIVGSLNLGVSDPKAGRFANPASLLVDGARVVVFGNETVLAAPVPGDPSAARPSLNYLTITFVDISDPAAPKVKQRVRIEGGLVAARRVGDAVRIVTKSSLSDLPMVSPMTPNGVKAALHQNRIAVAESSISDWIPDWDTGAKTKASPLMNCSDVVVPDTFSGVEMTSLVQFDLDGPFSPEALGVLAPSEDLTATATDAVVASHVWVDPASQTGTFKDWSTALHRFRFEADGPHYVGSGQVPGSIRDDFSLSVVNETTVGVVTVEGVPWSVEDNAKITVRTLVSDPKSTVLSEAGSLVPAGSGHWVSGLRFIGDRLLISSGLGGNNMSLVDLSTPTAPKDLGSLDLPGAGEYFHPVDKHRVLVVGGTVRAAGKTIITGTYSTLVDTSGTPTAVATWSKDYVSSSVGGDHHGFTWWSSRAMAGFGVYVSAPNGYSTSESLFLNLGKSDISARLVRPHEAYLGPKCPIEQVDRKGCDDSGQPMVYRVMVVNGAVWLYTSESLERLDPDSLASTSVVALPLFG